MAARPHPFRRRVVDVTFASLVAFVWVQGQGENSPFASSDLDPRLVGVRFEEVAEELGVTFRHASTSIDPELAHLEGMIAGVSASVSVCDANADGWPDLYATTARHGAPNALFVNRGDGTFEERAAEAGLADLNRDRVGCSTGSVWADWSGDGLDDVFVVKWGQPQLFLNEGDLSFRDVTEEAGLTGWINSNAANWIDFDLDGRLDLFVAGYYGEEHDLWDVDTTRVMHDSFEFAQNGGRNRLYRNLGDGTFEDATERLGADDRRWTLAAGVADMNGDGWPDLYLANDYAPEELLLNEGGERFVRAEGLGLEYESKSGMNVSFGNLGNDGNLAVFVTNISARGYLFQGNNLRVNHMAKGAGLWQRAAGAVVDCGWAWGAQFGDLDGDGWQDLFVVNGFISGSQDRSYWYPMSKVAGAAGDLVADAENWPAIEDRSLSGYERSRVLFRDPEKAARYIEAGLEVGVNDVLDGRGVALADLDRDGDLDAIVANQDGPLLVYRNATEKDHRWIAFDLEGTVSNGNALGAEVRVTSSVGEQVQVVTAASGFAAQNDRRVHFGLGAEPGPVEVAVRWPSGRVDRYEDLELDTAHRLLEVSQ